MTLPSEDPLLAAWDAAQPYLKLATSVPTYKFHIQSLRPISMTRGTGRTTIVLDAPSAFITKWVQTRCLETLQIALAEALMRTPDTIEIKITLRNAL